MTPTATQSAVSHWTDTDRLVVNAIRTLAMDAVQRAESGHPGTPMALAPLGYVLWSRHLKHHPGAPGWPDRDRFVLSCGHASMLLYALLHLAGYDLPIQELWNFRQWGSRTPGHPEHGLTPGVETTTGPLGQGIANAVGMAIAEAHLAARFNRPGHRIIDHRTYVLMSDGDMMEGISHEVCALAGHLQLGKLICCYDDNGITIDGSTSLSMSEHVAARYAAYDWHVQRVGDANDLEALDRALVAAEAEASRPSLIVVRTEIGYGSPNRAGTAKAHGEPLGADEVALTKKNLGWDWDEPFHVPLEAVARLRTLIKRGADDEQDWRARMAEYRRAHPTLAAELERRWRRELPEAWDANLPKFWAGESLATRQASGKTLNAIAASMPELIGGSADLAGSNNVLIDGGGDVAAEAPEARNLRFGVREHGMAGITSGLSLHGGTRPFAATFLIFSDYMRPAIRLAALMDQPVIYVFTHDSIGLGEDGPTHQPIEHLASLRAIPNLVVIRPADAAEAVEAWRVAITRLKGPTALILTRQKVPSLDRTRLAREEGVAHGAYVLSEPREAPRAVVIATGSEVHVALEAQELLWADEVPVRVVSMPSWELFRAQSSEYRDEVLLPGLAVRVSVEAGSPLGWREWVGDGGAIVGLERFGASAPYQALYRELEITAEQVVEAVKDRL